MKWIDAPWIELLRIALEVAATVAFALSGVMMAARKRFDAVGVCVVAFVSAFGGGTLRDLLLDQRPFFWVRHTEFVWGILGLSVAAMLFMRQRHFQPTERAMLLPDAIGLGLFAAVGVDIATAVGMPALIAVMMGVTTGVFGGVLRDVLCNEVPQAFSDHRPYALCAFAGGWADVALRQVEGTVVSPPLLLRSYGHESLMAHWLIVAGLDAALDRWSGKRWSLLVLTSALCHPYLLLMTLALAAAAAYTAIRIDRARRLSALLLQATAIAVLLIAVLNLAGYFAAVRGLAAPMTKSASTVCVSGRSSASSTRSVAQAGSDPPSVTTIREPRTPPLSATAMNSGRNNA